MILARDQCRGGTLSCLMRTTCPGARGVELVFHFARSCRSCKYSKLQRFQNVWTIWSRSLCLVSRLGFSSRTTEAGKVSNGICVKKCAGVSTLGSEGSELN
uniref:Uncharacterized protein n=1 Tax=Cacopsylla melanoneura TaxID=428564 RepID=A0A8D8Y7R9_9HEMI